MPSKTIINPSKNAKKTLESKHMNKKMLNNEIKENLEVIRKSQETIK